MDKVESKILSLFDNTLKKHSSKGVDSLFLSALLREKRGLSLFKGQVDSVEIADEIKMGVWLCVKGRWGNSVFENATPESLERAIDQAIQASTYNDTDPSYSLAPDSKIKTTDEPDPDITTLSIKTMEDHARQMEKMALSFSPLVKNVPDVGLGYDRITRVIVNSNGTRVVEKNGILKAGISIMACSADNRMVNVHEMEYWLKKKDFQPEHLVREVAQEVISRVSPRTIPTGKYPVIFDPQSSAQLLSSFISVFSGEALDQKLTKLEGKLDQEIASKKISLFETGKSGLVPHSFDAEGSPIQDKFLIQNGIFKTFLHNRYTAKKAGTQTTGNAGGGIEESPGVSPMNISWEPGADLKIFSSKDLFKIPQQAILVREMAGASASAISGDFSYGILGYWVENGEIQYPIADFTIAGNFFDLLKNIEAVGDDLRWFSPHLLGSTGGRTLLVSQLAVSGK